MPISKFLADTVLANRPADWLCNCGSPLDGSHDHASCGPPIPKTPPQELKQFFGRIAKNILERANRPHPFVSVVAVGRGDLTAAFKLPVPLLGEDRKTVLGEVVRVWVNGDYTWGEAKLNAEGEKLFATPPRESVNLVEDKTHDAEIADMVDGPPVPRESYKTTYDEDFIEIEDDYYTVLGGEG